MKATQLGFAPRLAVACLALASALAAPARRSSADDPFLRRTATVDVVQRVGPAVVNITTERIVRQRNPFRGFSGDPFFERFFNDIFEPRAPQTVQSLGSGVIIDAEGHILTNEHVIARASRVRATLADGREFGVSLVGADPNNDLAVLEAETDEDLPWVPPGTSSDLLVGEPVIAIGNPFGLSNTVTTGVISALDRSIRAGEHAFHGFLQTDASINPGNSGGPLLNAEGSLVGINSAIYGGGAQGIGFAIPIDTAMRVVSELIEHGEVQPVWLGLEFQDLDPLLSEVMNLPPHVIGALVNRVRKNSPAERAGLQRGDILMSLDGRDLRGARDFFESLETVTDGQRLELEVWRDAQVRQVSVTAREIPPGLIADLADQLLGMELEPTGQLGFRVTKVRRGSGATRIGIRKGDLVLGVNGRALNGQDDLRRAMLDLRGHDRALVVVQRGNGRYHVTIPLV